MFLVVAVMGTFASGSEGPAAGGNVERRPPNCPEPVAGGVLAKEPGSGGGLGDIRPPRLKSQVTAEYPPEVKTNRKLLSTVYVPGTVDIDGNVADVSSLNCSVTKADKKVEGIEKKNYCRAFSAAAEAAFLQWRYEPAMKGEKPACVYATAAFKFKP